MARWKAHVEFLLSVIELLFLSLTVEALQVKLCQNSLPSGRGIGHLEPWSHGAKISGGKGRLPAKEPCITWGADLPRGRAVLGVSSPLTMHCNAFAAK